MSKDSRTFAQLFEAHAAAFLADAVKWVDASRPYPEIEAQAANHPAKQAAAAVGAWIAEDLAARPKPVAAAQAMELRQRSSDVERIVGECSVKVQQMAGSGSISPGSASALENLAEVMLGVTDQVQALVSAGLLRAAGAPLLETRPGLALEDLSPEGARGERMAFAKPVARPAALALEPIAHLKQDLSRLKHYALRDTLSRAFHPMALPVSSSYFRAIRPPVELDGDLTEFKALSGVANAAESWANAMEEALEKAFFDRLQVRGVTALAGPAEGRDALLAALELERAARDLQGALDRDPDAAAIPAEGLISIIVGAKLPARGLLS